MGLTEDDLKEFACIWAAEFHEDITLDMARQVASSLLELYSVLARPLPSETKPAPNHEILPLLPEVQ